MKNAKAMAVGMGLLGYFMLCTMVWADGGNLPDQKCPGISPQDPVFQGTFTATYGKFNEKKPTVYVIKYKLKKLQKSKEKNIWKEESDEFTFERKIPLNPKGLCVDDMDDLIHVYDEYVKRGKENAAGKLGFGPDYEACLTHVIITSKPNCTMNDAKAKVEGEFSVRIFKPVP